MLSASELDMVTRVQILDTADYFSYSYNTLRKDRNYSLYSYVQIVRLTGLFSLNSATSLGEGKFNTFKIHWKIELVSYPACVEGVGKYKL